MLRALLAFACLLALLAPAAEAADPLDWPDRRFAPCAALDDAHGDLYVFGGRAEGAGGTSATRGGSTSGGPPRAGSRSRRPDDAGRAAARAQLRGGVRSPRRGSCSSSAAGTASRATNGVWALTRDGRAGAGSATPPRAAPGRLRGARRRPSTTPWAAGCSCSAASTGSTATTSGRCRSTSAPRWRRLPAAGPQPAPRAGHSLAYDAERRRAWLFGGTTSGADLGDTWALRSRRRRPGARSRAAGPAPARAPSSCTTRARTAGPARRLGVGAEPLPARHLDARRPRRDAQLEAGTARQRGAAAALLRRRRVRPADAPDARVRRRDRRERVQGHGRAAARRPHRLGGRSRRARRRRRATRWRSGSTREARGARSRSAASAPARSPAGRTPARISPTRGGSAPRRRAWRAATPRTGEPIAAAPRGGRGRLRPADGPASFVIGGLEGDSELADAWVADTGGRGRLDWRALCSPSSCGPGPEPRWGGHAVYDPAGDRVIVFGGRRTDGTSFDDVWALALAGAPRWDAARRRGRAAGAALGRRRRASTRRRGGWSSPAGRPAPTRAPSATTTPGR